MAKAKNSTRFKNSFEAVCVFNAVCEHLIIHSLCSKEYKSIGISVYSGHAYFTCSHRLICQTAPGSVPGYGRSVSRDSCCFSSGWDWSVRATGNEVRVEVPVEPMTMIKTRVLEGLNLHLVLLSMFLLHYSGAITTKESDWLSWDQCQMDFSLYHHGHQWQACVLKKKQQHDFSFWYILHYLSFFQVPKLSVMHLITSFTVILSELNCILLSGRFNSTSDLSYLSITLVNSSLSVLRAVIRFHNLKPPKWSPGAGGDCWRLV